VVVVLAVIIFLTWFFLGSAFWRLQNLNVVGLTRVDPSGLEKIVWDQTGERRGLFFHQSDIFLFNKQEAEQAIGANYNFAGVNINKIWPRTLKINVQERPYAFIYQEGSSLFYAAADGYIIKEPAVSPDDQKKYLILENKNSATLIGDDNKIKVTSGYLSFLLDLNNHLAAEAADLPLERFIIDQELNTVKVKFSNGPLVYFNVQDSAEDQISRLLLVKKEKIKDNFSKTNYIDLRYGDRVFINPDFK
jgi:cell division septal protein FtsQ